MNKINTGMQQRISLSILCFLVVIILFSCKKEQAITQQAIMSSDLSNAKADITVHAGESIQVAIDAAQSNSLIKIEPGTYAESITINKAGIKLVGITQKGKGVIIQNPGDEEDGVTVSDAGDGFTLQNVMVSGFEENGVVLDSVDNFTISHVTAINNGEYGIFPAHSSHGLIEHCTVSGHTDTGIYVGQSSDVNMQFNTAFENVNGLEVENSSDVNVTNNQSHDNVCGILIDLLPDKDIKTSTNVYVGMNHVFNNNHENFGDSGELESVVPPGLGILVLGTDKTTVENNTVTGNDFAGITVFSTLVLEILSGSEEGFDDIEPNPDNTYIAGNVLNKNGLNPPPLPIPLPGVDLLWDGSGVNNCWTNNKFKTSYPSPLPSCN
jgi:parallel beta-helix repeat protein